MYPDLQSFINCLRREGEIVEIAAPVSPDLEAAEIHRRVIAEGGPALLFRSIKGSSFPLATNLFGTKRRIELAFGPRPEAFMRALADLPKQQLAPNLSTLWRSRSVVKGMLKIGFKHSRQGPVTHQRFSPARLESLPLLKTWEEDGGCFITLPLVHTEDPLKPLSNLGMYRMQRYDHQTTGMHMQIGKGGGFHLAQAKELGRRLPVNVYIGGPPALILSAIAPLPENVPELLLASMILGKKLPLVKNSAGPLPLIGSAEFALVGEIDPAELRPEGPFGDHYGYYSLKHDYPVFRCNAMFHRRHAICAATVVGKPKQEDFFLGDYLQELLSPVFPLVMPAVEDLWSYGETGYHSLAAAVVKQRYKREAMATAFRILGEGQLSLTKFLLLTDRRQNLRDFKSVLEYVLERADFATDLYVLSNLAMDTLDYTGPKVNHGSKGVLLGVGDSIRRLSREFSGDLPSGVSKVKPFCGGCLVVQGENFSVEPLLAQRIAREATFEAWPLIVLVDDVEKTVSSSSQFLWTTFTRFEPGADIYAAKRDINRNHLSFTPPIVIDARMKPSYPAELECDQETVRLVDRRWNEYFPGK